MTSYINLPYHQAAFHIICSSHRDDIHFGLIEKYRAYRRELFLQKFKQGVPIDSDIAWKFAREALEKLDGEMGAILSKHSVAFWLHIYRRVGVALSSDHENKTDATTLGLVRTIVELAIQKHGKLDGIQELVFSDEINPELILGGWMKKSFQFSDGRTSKGYTRF